MNIQEILPIVTSLALGTGLAAACGFRVFVPLFIASLGHRFLGFQLNESFTWMSTSPMLITLGTATVLEIGAYLFPYIDNILDIINKPLAVAAGTLIAASTFMPLGDNIHWILSLILGGGTAGIFHMATSALRVGSTATTAGIVNPVLSITETFFSIVASIVSILLPLLALFFIIIVFYLIRRRIKRR